MNPSRRQFLKTTGVICGASSLPGWILEGQAAEARAMDKNELADIAIARAKKLGATYADIRINRYRGESISTREERVLNVSQHQSFGFGVRVLMKGAWGFAASHKVTPQAVRRAVDQALDIAKANGTYKRKPIQL